jgi:murein DD-endopeptidase MepM/ murein hydrolase activator NlpD
MKRTAVAALAMLAIAVGTARAQPPIGFTIGTAQPQLAAAVPQVSLPSASTPNDPGSISVPVSFETAPEQPQQLSIDQLRPIWEHAGAAYGIPWQVLAAINKIESNFGQNMGPSSAGAIGWMQFIPSTWLRWGTDADGNGVADPWTATDAIYSAARYLAAAGGQTDIRRGVFAYNHADWYVNEVLGLAQVYGGSAPAQTADLERVQAALQQARARVVEANHAAVAADEALDRLQVKADDLHAHAASAQLLSDRLAAERDAVLFDGQVHDAILQAQAKRAALARARDALSAATRNASAPSFTPAVGTLMGAPSYSGGYVFPVGGGPQVVSVGHYHHDYPAADIAAPAGSPLYALADGVVESAWEGVDPRCGIGFTIRAFDGRLWTYCHMSFRDPAVTVGASLHAGQSVGLVGMTGHATGPHLHLQLQPATEYPQDEAWFEGFAGKAFRWQDAPTPLRSLESVASAQGRVFRVVEESTPVIGFTR